MHPAMSLHCTSTANKPDASCCLHDVSPHQLSVISLPSYLSVISLPSYRPYLYSLSLRGLSPRANYTDRAAAAGRRS